MHRQEIVERLNRAAAEVDGWSDIQFSSLMSEWVGWPADIQGFKNPIPDYCSPDVPHARLVGLLRKVKQPDGKKWGLFKEACGTLLDLDIGGHFNLFYHMTAPPFYIVAACLAALDKLPDGITLDMIRGLEETE